MDIEFDTAKDESNIAKHGISLARAVDLEILVFLEDDRKAYGETRYRAWGLIDGKHTASLWPIAKGVSPRSVFAGRAKRRWNGMSHDDENPEWRKEDFKKAQPASELPAEILKAFPRTRGRQKAPTKVAVSIRLSQSVLDHYRADGPGWQSRIDNDLKKIAGRKRSSARPIVKRST